MPIVSHLETHRVQELDNLLTLLHPRIIDYVASADPNSDAYKSNSLGSYHEPAKLKEIFQDDFDTGLRHDTDRLFAHLDKVLKYSVNTWNPGFLDKLYASNNPIGVVGDMILSILNTNSHVYTVSPVLSVVENQIGHKYALMFFDQQTCGGLTFSGGSWSNITAMHMARALRFPQTKTRGNGALNFAVFTSKHCHYSVEKSAILLGLGSDNVFKVPVKKDGTMEADALEDTILRAKNDGFTPLFINATAGTTVFGLYDDLEAIGAIAKRHNIWLHVDGSWGGNVIFLEKYAYRMKGCLQVDSITTNPHKMLGVPTTCSFLLVPNVADFQTANSLKAPYLFHGREADGENFDLADGTMGCGRRADLFKFHLAWLYYGFEGLRERVDHAYAIVQYFVEKARETPGFKLVTEEPQCLQVCFYYVPESYKESDYTAVTRHVSRELHSRGQYLVDFSPNPDDNTHGEFFRVVFNLPILTDTVVDDLVQSIVAVAAEM